MNTLGEMFQIAAATLPIWRDLVIGGLASVVVGALYVYATVLDVR